MSLGSKGGGTPAQQTQSSEPWGPSQPYLKEILGQANTMYGKGGSYYPFSTTVPLSPDSQNALSGMRNYANAGNPLLGQASGALSGILGGNSSDPGIGGLQKTAAGDSGFARELFGSLKGDVIDATNSQFSMAGRSGSPAAMDTMTKRLGDLATGIYGQERGYQQNAQNTLANLVNSGMGQAGNLWQQGLDPYRTLGQVGQTYEDQASRQLQDLTGRWDYGQNAGWNSLNKLSGIVSPFASAGGTTTGTSTPSEASQSQQMMGMAASIASIVAAF